MSSLTILSIAHSAVSLEGGRLRYYPLMRRRDLDVHLVVPARWHEFGRDIVADPPNDHGPTVHVLPSLLTRGGPMSWYLHFYPHLPGLIRRLRPDVIHLWEEPWSVVALEARLFKGDAALVLEVDQNILKRLPPPFEAMRRHVLRATDHILSRSPEATAVVRANGYAGPVSAIGHGVDLTTFRPADDAPGGDREVLRLGYVGRIVEEKGLDDALDAMMRCKVRTSLSVMGEGPYEPQLRRRIAEYGLEDRVSFRGWGTAAEVAEFIHGLDILVLLTRTTKDVCEQFGRVIIEAQSCGVPVIGSDCGAIPDVVGAGGWIVPERAPDRLAALLDDLAGDPARRKVQSAAARVNARSRFSYDAISEALASAWINAAASRRSSARSGVPVAKLPRS